ncbi:MAG: protein kinase [Chloroflexota bacterium]|nr:protein kinase [Chloroflexota bacterium]
MAVFDNQTGRLTPQSLLHQRYLIAGLVGRGGMSAVYRARDTRATRASGSYVALKEMSQHNLSGADLMEATERFQQESRLLSSLSHPNLPRIYDAFSEDGRYYLVMDFIDGKTLLQLLKETGGKPLPVPLVLKYAIQLCAVLIYLHQQRPPIIFRDLKPANVMVTPDGHVFLIDFGIARIFKEGQQQDTVFLGSPGYAPPEQHGVAQTNPRSDLYSLGATLHCCLTGQDPYHAADRFLFQPIRQYNPSVPPELELLVQRLVALDEQQRPASAMEVQQVLIRISQQMVATPGPARSVADASAPTQYMPPDRAGNNAPLVLSPTMPTYNATSPATPTAPFSHQEPTVAVQRSAPAPVSRPPDTAAPAPLPSRSGSATSRAPVWTKSFITTALLLLLVSLASGVFALGVLSQPPPIPYGLVFLAASGLSLLAFLTAAVASTKIQSIAARGILFSTGLAMLVMTFAFLGLGLGDIQGWLATLLSMQRINVNSLLDTLVTGGLVVAAALSFLWLIRPFLLRERALLFILFGIAFVCALLQHFSGATDTQVARHLMLLLALTALAQGILLAVRAERVQEGSN